LIDKIKLITKKWAQLIMELLVVFPVLLILGICIISDYMLWIWFGFIALYCLAGLLAGGFLKRGRRFIPVAIGIIISGAGAYFLFDSVPAQVVTGALGVIAFMRGIQLRGNRWEEMFPHTGLWGGLAAYSIGYFFFTRVEALKPYIGIFGWVGIIYMILVLFVINFNQLKSASLPGDKEPVLPQIIKKYNRLLITIMLMLVGIISFFDRLKEGVLWLSNTIGYLVMKFIVFLSQLLAASKQGGMNPEGGGGIFDLLPPIEEKPPSIFDYIIQIISIVIAIIAGLVIIALMGFALFKLFKKIAAWLTRFYELGKDMEDYGGYVDEEEKLMDFRELGKDYAERFRQWLAGLMEREPKWDELKTNKERIRFIYRHFLLRCIAGGYNYKKHLTPVETGKELSKWHPDKAQDLMELAEAYDCARYGDKEVDDSKMQKLIQSFLKE